MKGISARETEVRQPVKRRTRNKSSWKMHRGEGRRERGTTWKEKESERERVCVCMCGQKQRRTDEQKERYQTK